MKMHSKRAISIICAVALLLSMQTVFATDAAARKTVDLSLIPVEDIKFMNGVITSDLYRSSKQMSIDFIENAIADIDYETAGAFKVFEGENVEKALASHILDYGSDLITTQLNDDVYVIQYKTSEGKEVGAQYDSMGLQSVTVYNPSLDQVSSANYVMGTAEVFDNARMNTTPELTLTDAELAQINSYLDDNNFDAIRGMPGIYVITDADGDIIIEKNTKRDTLAATAQKKSNEADIIALRKRDWPEQYDYKLYDGYLTDTYTRKNVHTILYRSTYNYVRTSANYSSFAIGTTLTAISIAVGWPLKAVDWLLTGLGVLISANDLIQEAVDLYTSYNMSYRCDNDGVVYDSVSNFPSNKFVLCYHVTANGKLSGGYDSIDNDRKQFRWVNSSPASTFEPNVAQKALTTVSYYSRDLTTHNGICTYPAYK